MLELHRPVGWSVEKEIRILLRAQKAPDTSKLACQRYAARLVQDVIPGWQIGDKLTHLEAQRIGAEFDRRLHMTGAHIDRLQQPPFRNRANDTK